jgi:superfamily II DNA or RNA helicase
MAMTFDFKPGSLVTLRNRPWVVLPSEDKDLLLVKPLGGSEEEITGIYKPLASSTDFPVSYDFVKPADMDLGDFASARLLYNAARVAFRSAAGPFRCLGKLSFRPRSYQMVPLIMALKQETVRLLIADDVGVGKTIEALLIAKELYERREIKRFAIVCLPHLCDQWQDELKNKFGIDTVIIRSGTATGLERKIRTNENIFKAYPFQIISIDYIKSGSKRQIFIDHCPEMIIVDEAHSCAKPSGANDSQQLRYHLINDISSKGNQHLLLLTATPHSGKQEEFQSLLGLLDKDFERIDIVTSSEAERKRIARHFVQRRRADIVKWLDEETFFPERISVDIGYKVGNEYGELFNDILAYARESVAANIESERKQRYSYWDALALLRGVMSSPSSGCLMLENKAHKKAGEDSSDDNESVNEDKSVLDNGHAQDDNLPASWSGKSKHTDEAGSRKLLGYAKRMKELHGITKDIKAREAISAIQRFLDKGLNPIVYCRFIYTADYLGELFKENLKGSKYKKLHIEVVTSTLDDELRRDKIDKMLLSERRLLIATDCLSEGINLQEGFNAVLHYDLPWNPNRLEQREGRVDRFGQQSKTIEVVRLHGSNNPVDGVVLDVLYKKADEIRKSIGITVPIPEDSPSVMNAIMQAVFIRNIGIQQAAATQLSLFETDEYNAEIKVLVERERVSRTIFAQNAIKANEIEEDLKEVDEAIGNVLAVETFVVESLRFLGVQVDIKDEGYRISSINIPQKLRELLTEKNEILVSFKSPTPAGYKYIGRNHPFTEQLSQTIIDSALKVTGRCAARAAVLRTMAVSKKTALFQLRVRNVIAEEKNRNEIVAEEMWLWGYRGNISSRDFIPKSEAMDLFLSAKAGGNLEVPEQKYWLSEELDWVCNEKIFRGYTDEVALSRATHLVEAHTRFKKLIASSKYKVVEPVLPVDVMGIYILLPIVQS